MELNKIYPDISLPPDFKVVASAGGLTIFRMDYEAAVKRLFDADSSAVGPNTVQGRGNYHISEIISQSGQPAEAILKTCKRGGLISSIMPDVFSDAKRPLNELVVTEQARRARVPVPEILGIEIKSNGAGFNRVRIIYKRIADALTIEEAIIKKFSVLSGNRQELYQYKNKIINSIARAIKKMHLAEVYHADLNIRNILIQQGLASGPEMQVYLIDLDKSVHISGELAFDKKIANLIRLNRSLDKLFFIAGDSEISNLISRTDRLRLLTEYLNEQNISGKQKRTIVRKCLLNSRIHKWWWHLWGLRKSSLV